LISPGIKMETASFNLNNFAHDLSNLIAVIKLYAQLGLRDPSARESLKENLKIILDQADTAIRLTENMKKAMAGESIIPIPMKILIMAIK
jgi:signal transduction histidine kinase